MAHELENTGKTGAGESSKNNLNSREYLKGSVAVAAIVAGSGLGSTAVRSADGTGEAFNTGFGEYA